MPLSQKQHPQQNATQHVTKLARWRGRGVGIVINACPGARERKRVIVADTKFAFEDNGQRRHPTPKNVKNQGTPVDNVCANLIVNDVIVRRNATLG